jgi:hypothetical protein
MVTIAGRRIGRGELCFVIAEAGVKPQRHRRPHSGTDPGGSGSQPTTLVSRCGAGIHIEPGTQLTMELLYTTA